MRPTFGDIKTKALSSLKGRWSEAIAASMILVAVSLLNSFLQTILMQVFKVDAIWTFYSPMELPKYNTVASICISLFSALFSLLIVFPLFFGVLRWFWMITGEEKASLDGIFYYFSSGKLFFRALSVAFGVLWRVTVGAVICFIPLVIANLVSSPWIYSVFGYAMPIWMSGMYSMHSTIKFFCICLFILWSLRYSLFYAAALFSPGISVRAVFRRSIDMTRGNLLRFLGFVFSFIGWYFISILVLPIVFVIPYMLAAFSVYGHTECTVFAAEPAV